MGHIFAMSISKG
jgi:hypothetical protein